MKMRAPEGCTGYSVGGTSQPIDSDGTVTVGPDLAEILKSHGFVDVNYKPPSQDTAVVAAAAATLPPDFVAVPRKLTVQLLHALDFTIASEDMTTENLVGLLEQAVHGLKPQPEPQRNRRKEAA